MKNQPKNSKIEKSEIEIFLKNFDEKIDFSSFSKKSIFLIFIENPMKLFDFSTGFSGLRYVQLQIDLPPKVLRGRSPASKSDTSDR